MKVEISAGVVVDLGLNRPWITLPSGRRIQLDVRHLKNVPHPRLKFDPIEGGEWPTEPLALRCTLVAIIEQRGNHWWVIPAIAWCGPGDNFCRRTGRKRAVEKLLGYSLRAIYGGDCKSPGKAAVFEVFEDGHTVLLPAFSAGFGKNDRGVIFQNVCPEYVKEGERSSC